MCGCQLYFGEPSKTAVRIAYAQEAIANLGRTASEKKRSMSKLERFAELTKIKTTHRKRR